MHGIKGEIQVVELMLDRFHSTGSMNYILHFVCE